MTVDLTPCMRHAISTIGRRSVTAHEIGVNGGVLKRLCELGFLKMDMPKEGYCPPWYSLSPKGEGAAAILNAPLHPVDHEAPIARIKRNVAEFYRIPEIEMISARRSRRVARPRQVAMYLAKKLTPKSLPEIGRCFGNRDHTTVLHGVRKIEALMAEDHKLQDEVTTLFRQIVSEKSGKSGDKSIVSNTGAEA